MNFLLEITKDDYATKNLLSQFDFIEVLMFGGKMLLIGIIAVFAVLCIIWALLIVFGKVFNKTKPVIQEVKQPETAVVESVTYAPRNDDEVIAAIAAAIAMAESEGSGAKFRVVSFRRK